MRGALSAQRWGHVPESPGSRRIERRTPHQVRQLRRERRDAIPLRCHAEFLDVDPTGGRVGGTSKALLVGERVTRTGSLEGRDARPAIEGHRRHDGFEDSFGVIASGQGERCRIDALFCGEGEHEHSLGCVRDAAVEREQSLKRHRSSGPERQQCLQHIRIGRVLDEFDLRLKLGPGPKFRIVEGEARLASTRVTGQRLSGGEGDLDSATFGRIAPERESKKGVFGGDPSHRKPPSGYRQEALMVACGMRARTLRRGGFARLAVPVPAGLMPGMHQLRWVWRLAVLAALPMGSADAVHSRRASIPATRWAPYCSGRDLVLLEPGRAGQVDQVVVIGCIRRPPVAVFDALMDVDAYPRIVRTMSETKILSERRQGPRRAVRFSWRLDLPVVPDLEGEREQRGQAPTWVESRGRSGHFRQSRDRWEILSIGPESTMVALHRRLDLETGGMLLREIIRSRPVLSQGVHAATGLVHLNGLRRWLESKGASQTPASPRTPLPTSVRPLLQPLLALGPVALVERDADGRFHGVHAIRHVDAAEPTLRALIQDVERYETFVPTVAAIRYGAPADGSAQRPVRWSLEAPLMNLEGEGRVLRSPAGLRLETTSGDIKGGVLDWHTETEGDGDVYLYHTARARVADANLLTRRFVARDPYYEHALVAAASLIAVEGMRVEAERHLAAPRGVSDGASPRIQRTVQ